MADVITLTPNPALDLSTRVDRLIPTHKLRCGPALRHPGGGGINVARVLHRLGTPVQAWYLAGGPTGAVLRQLLEDEGVPARMLPIAGATRENFAVIETGTGREYRFVLPGPEVNEREWRDCLDRLTVLPAPPDMAPRWLVLSGGLAPGMPEDFYARLAQALRPRGTRIALDSTGAALAAALQVGVDVVKPSLSELCAYTGQPLSTLAERCAAAHALVRAGRAGWVALSLGEQGAVLAHADGLWHAPALPVPAALGTTGAGDSFLAGLLWAIERGDAPPEALRQAMACGAAALLGAGTALARREDIERLAPGVQVGAVPLP